MVPSVFEDDCTEWCGGASQSPHTHHLHDWEKGRRPEQGREHPNGADITDRHREEKHDISTRRNAIHKNYSLNLVRESTFGKGVVNSQGEREYNPKTMLVTYSASMTGQMETNGSQWANDVKQQQQLVGRSVGRH